MKPTHLAVFACGFALLLGACSSSPPAPGLTPGGEEVLPKVLEPADDAVKKAEMEKTQAAINDARDALENAVQTAQSAVDATQSAVQEAERELERAKDYRTDQLSVLNSLQDQIGGPATVTLATAAEALEAAERAVDAAQSEPTEDTIKTARDALDNAVREAELAVQAAERAALDAQEELKIARAFQTRQTNFLNSLQEQIGGGSGTAAPDPDGGPDPTEPGERTELQVAFDTKLEEAETALADARQEVTAAELAAIAAVTEAERTAAQKKIEDVRKALAAALVLARALEAPDGDERRIGLAILHVRTATQAEKDDLEKLVVAEGRIGAWSAATRTQTGQASSQRPLSVVRNLRQTNTGGDTTTLLKAADLPAVMYEDGKIMIAEGSASSGDRLRMRGLPVGWTTDTSGGGSRRGYLLYPSAFDVDGNDGELRPVRTVAGLKITNEGLVVDIGGATAFGGDFVISTSDTQPSFNGASPPNAYDLTLSFGGPAASPLGAAEYYWEEPLMPTLDQRESSTNGFLKDGERILPLGTYYLRLSNHLGLNKGTEYADGRSYPDDDTNDYLSYAAYGFFDFASRFPAGRNGSIDRAFPFHVGYDAFSGARGMKVTDVADADEIINGKFEGRTMASELTLATAGGAYVSKLPRAANNSRRLQGDIELTATISGTSSENVISGKIENLESWNRVLRRWEDFASITGHVVLSQGTISESGSFTGTVAAPTTNYHAGEYRGNFYGPLDGLEAAGIWYLQTNMGGTVDKPIVGSFGVQRVPAAD